MGQRFATNAVAACFAIAGAACSTGTGDDAGTGSIVESATTTSSDAINGSPPSVGDRSYSLGFTPFPHAVNEAAVDDAYSVIANDADLFAFHTTEGVPWVAASSGEGIDGYGAHLRGTWDRHRAEMDANPDHEVYLGLTPLDDSRSRIADLWDTSDHQAVPPGFEGAAFDDPQVVEAYTSFVLTAVDWYQPDYLAIGIEGNLLAKNTPTAFAGFAALMNHTYMAVKRAHPDLPVFVTVTGVDILEGWTDVDHQAQRVAVDALLETSDYLAVSLYPFMSVHLTNGWPADTFDLLAALADGRPLAIAETGYPAQTTELPSYGLTFEGTPAKQLEWATAVLDAAERHEMTFVVNFIGRDYDELWATIGSTDLFAIWRDTGLYDELGQTRPALVAWREALTEPRTNR